MSWFVNKSKHPVPARLHDYKHGALARPMPNRANRFRHAQEQEAGISTTISKYAVQLVNFPTTVLLSLQRPCLHTLYGRQAAPQHSYDLWKLGTGLFPPPRW